MAKKKNMPTGFSNVTCDKCGVDGHSREGKLHRRCMGSTGKGIRPKHEPIARGKRGTWR